MGLNVVLGVLAYRDLLTFRPQVINADSAAIAAGDELLFASSETAPLMIVLLSLWLLYHRRVEFFALPERAGPVWLAGVAFFLGSAIFVWAVYTQAFDILAFSLIANLIGSAILWRGLPAVRVAVMPLVLLLFAVPLPAPWVAQWVWEFQLATAVLSGWMLYLIQIPAVVSADIIQLSGDTYQVIEGCSGFRSILSLMIFSILMANMFDRGRWHALGLLLVSIPIAFAMNGLRVVTLILNPASEIHTIHVAQGLVVLMGGLILLYGVDDLIARVRKRDPASQDLRRRTANAESSEDAGGIPQLHRAVGVLCLLLLMLGTLNFMPRWQFRGSGGVNVDLALERVTGGWESREIKTVDSNFSTASFRQFHRRRYSEPGPAGGATMPRLASAAPPIDVFLGIGEHLNRFRSPRSPKNAFPGRGWVTEDRGETQLKGTDTPINWRLLRSGTHRVIAYQWYEGDRGLLREGARSFLALDRSPFSRNLPVIAVRIAVEVETKTPSDIKQAHQRLAAFHSRVAVALRSLKAGLRPADDSETSRLPDFPLWERFFPFGSRSEIISISKNSSLGVTGPVA
jgi:exosortase